VEAAK